MNYLFPAPCVKCTESGHWPVCLLEPLLGAWDTWEEAGAGVGGQKSEGQQEEYQIYSSMAMCTVCSE